MRKTVIYILILVTSLVAQSLRAAGWKIVTSPNVGSGSNFLAGTSAAGDDDVWAVGQIFNTSLAQDQTLIEHWNGKRWSVVPSPNATSFNNFLSAVAVTASNDVWAVGTSASDTSGDANSLIEHWDGSAWSIIPSPNLSGATESLLLGVTVIASNDVWAVGYARVDDQIVLLTEHWNGRAWKVVPALPDDNEMIMTSVTAVATDDVWAGGVGTDDLTPLAFHWDGTQWSVVGVPFTFYEPSGIYAVAAIASDDVWLMGPDGRYATFNLNWNGSQIDQVHSPKFKNGRTYGGLRGIVALAADNIWAVGAIVNRSFNQTLIEHWDGSDWAVVASPTVANADSTLSGVTKTPGGTLWAVGGDTPSGEAGRTLILRNAP